MRTPKRLRTMSGDRLKKGGSTASLLRQSVGRHKNKHELLCSTMGHVQRRITPISWPRVGLIENNRCLYGRCIQNSLGIFVKFGSNFPLPSASGRRSSYIQITMDFKSTQLDNICPSHSCSSAHIADTTATRAHRSEPSRKKVKVIQS